MADDDVLDWPIDTEEYIKFDVTSPVDPLADPVYIALVPRGQDRTADDFADAEWTPGQTWENGDTPLQVRRFLPAATLTNKITYKAAVKISDDPEVPVIPAGTVKGVL